MPRSLYLSLLTGIIAYAAQSTLRAEIVSQWLTAANGDWSNAANWSTDPIAPLKPTHSALIAATGSPYTVTLSTAADLRKLTIDSPDATLVIDGFSVSAADGINLAAGRLNLVAGTILNSRLSGGGSYYFDHYGAQSPKFENVQIASNVDAGNLNLAGFIELEGTLLSTLEGDLFTGAPGSGHGITGSGTWRVGDTPPAFAAGYDYRLQGNNGEFVIGPDVTLESRGRRTSIYGDPGTVLVNQGTIAARSFGEFLRFSSAVRNEGTMDVGSGATLFIQNGANGPATHVGQLAISAGGKAVLSGSLNFAAPVVVGPYAQLTVTDYDAPLTPTPDGAAPISLEGGTVAITSLATAPAINAAGGTVLLNGTFTPAEIAQLPVSGSASIQLDEVRSNVSIIFPTAGTIDIADGVLDLQALPRPVEVVSGRVMNGSLSNGGQPLSVSASLQGGLRLSDVAVDDRLVINSGHVLADLGTQFHGGVVLNDGVLTISDSTAYQSAVTVNAGGLLIAEAAPPPTAQVSINGGEFKIAYNATLADFQSLQFGPSSAIRIGRRPWAWQLPDPVGSYSLALQGGALDLATNDVALSVDDNGAIDGGGLPGSVIHGGYGAPLTLAGGSLRNLMIDSVRLDGHGSLSSVVADDLWIADQTSYFLGNVELAGETRIDGAVRGDFTFAAGASLAGHGQFALTSGRNQYTSVTVLGEQFTIPADFGIVNATPYDGTMEFDAAGTDLAIAGDIRLGATYARDSWTDSLTLTVGSLRTTGDVAVTDDGRLKIVGGPWNHAGSARLMGGRIETPSLFIEEGGTLAGGGDMILNDGTLSVAGEVDVELAHAPLAIQGSAEFTDAGALMLELSRDHAEKPLLTATGELQLGGVLALSVSDDFFAEPLAVGERFQLTEAGSILGNFDSWSIPPSAYDWQLIADAHSLAIEVVAVSPAPGDFNLDGWVDGVDFLAWQRGDSPHAGAASDLAEWRANYGGVGGSTAASATIPEPAAVLHIALAAVAIVTGRSRVTPAPACCRLPTLASLSLSSRR